MKSIARISHFATPGGKRGIEAFSSPFALKAFLGLDPKFLPSGLERFQAVENHPHLDIGQLPFAAHLGQKMRFQVFVDLSGRQELPDNLIAEKLFAQRLTALSADDDPVLGQGLRPLLLVIRGGIGRNRSQERLGFFEDVLVEGLTLPQEVPGLIIFRSLGRDLILEVFLENADGFPEEFVAPLGIQENVSLDDRYGGFSAISLTQFHE
ncbi:MAG: hypothetical protein A2Y86_07340 [Candidatus Aminicenantes bacterium RBG_13_62_12]|nr:MAG: hypothetical protein A2Y86_07340 [Candidatus Aminicenantes bacterium RBG_13_62_12]